MKNISLKETILDQAALERTLSKAGEICSKSGTRFTDKRRSVLQQLIVSSVPLSAYEIADAFNDKDGSSMPTMSIYRILEFLETEQLVHKLSSANKYVACSHINCSHSHEVPQFLICGKCKAVKEISVSESVVKKLRSEVSNAGYNLTNSHLEINCTCNVCLTTITQ